MGSPDQAGMGAARATEREQLSEVLGELRRAMLGGCEALTAYDQRALVEQTERQQMLAALVYELLARGAARELPEAVVLQIHELEALNRLQRTLAAGGCRALQVEINLARLAANQGGPARDE